jgi:hypothetical protein
MTGERLGRSRPQNRVKTHTTRSRAAERIALARRRGRKWIVIRKCLRPGPAARCRCERVVIGKCLRRWPAASCRRERIVCRGWGSRERLVPGKWIVVHGAILGRARHILISGRGSLWLLIEGRGWFWLLIDGRGWFWLLIEGRGWFWLLIEGRGRLWL